MEEKQIFIPKDSLVRIFFKNGTIVEGVVLTWSDKKGLLLASDSQNRMIIYNPAENVIMVKLLLEQPNITPKEMPQQPQEIVEQPVAKEIVDDLLIDNSEMPDQSDSLKDRAKKIANYRLSRTSQEKKQVVESVKESLKSGVILDYSKQLPTVDTKYYEPPNFTQRRSSNNS